MSNIDNIIKEYEKDFGLATKKKTMPDQEFGALKRHLERLKEDRENAVANLDEIAEQDAPLDDIRDENGNKIDLKVKSLAGLAKYKEELLAEYDNSIKAAEDEINKENEKRAKNAEKETGAWIYRLEGMSKDKSVKNLSDLQVELNAELRNINAQIVEKEKQLKFLEVNGDVEIEKINAAREQELAKIKEDYDKKLESIKAGLDSKDNDEYKKAMAENSKFAAEYAAKRNSITKKYDASVAKISKDANTLKKEIADLNVQKEKANKYISACKEAWNIPEHIRRNKDARDKKAQDVVNNYLGIEEKITEPTGPEPTEPTGPKPTEPTRPKPTEPTGPKPTEPTGPKPTEPTGPKPTETTGPKPTEPTGPKPTEPTGPKPTEPTGPKPTEPTEPKTIEPTGPQQEGDEEKKSPQNERTTIKKEYQEQQEALEAKLEKPLDYMVPYLYASDLASIADYAAVAEIISNTKGAAWVKEGYEFNDPRLSDRQNLNMNSGKNDLALIMKQAAKEVSNGKMTKEEFGQLRKLLLGKEDGKPDNRGLKLLMAEKYLTQVAKKEQMNNVSQITSLTAGQLRGLIDMLNEVDKFVDNNQSIKMDNNRVVRDSEKLFLNIDVSRRGSLSKEEFARAKEIAYQYRGIAKVRASIPTRIAWFLRDKDLIKSKFDEPKLLTDGSANAAVYSRDENDKLVKDLSKVQPEKYDLNLESQEVANRKNEAHRKEIEFLSKLEGDAYIKRVYDMRTNVNKDELSREQDAYEKQLDALRLTKFPTPNIYTDKAGKHFEKWSKVNDDAIPVEFYRKYTRKNEKTGDIEEYFVSYTDLPENPYDETRDEEATREFAEKKTWPRILEEQIKKNSKDKDEDKTKMMEDYDVNKPENKKIIEEEMRAAAASSSVIREEKNKNRGKMLTEEEQAMVRAGKSGHMGYKKSIEDDLEK